MIRPTAEEVLEVIEMHASFSMEDTLDAELIYRWSHISENSTCKANHDSWIVDFREWQMVIQICNMSPFDKSQLNLTRYYDIEKVEK